MGVDTTWVNGVAEELRTFFKQKATRRGWLHWRHAYTFLAVFGGMPLSIGIASWALKHLANSRTWPEYTLVLAAIFLTFAFLFCFRLVFNLARRLYPKVEGPERSHGVARTVLFTIAMGLLIATVKTFLSAFGVRLL